MPIRKRHAAKRHRVQRMAHVVGEITTEVRIESGIEIKTIRVDRLDPRNSRIISPVRPAAIVRLAQHASGSMR